MNKHFIFQGDLTIITDDETNKFVSNLAGKTDHWIGAYRVGNENEIDQFAWVDGSSLANQQFGGSGADNAGGNEFCVAIFDTLSNNNGKLNDYDCWSSHPNHAIKNFVCQSSLSSKTKTIKEGKNTNDYSKSRVVHFLKFQKNIYQCIVQITFNYYIFQNVQMAGPILIKQRDATNYFQSLA